MSDSELPSVVIIYFMFSAATGNHLLLGLRLHGSLLRLLVLAHLLCSGVFSKEKETDGSRCRQHKVTCLLCIGQGNVPRQTSCHSAAPKAGLAVRWTQTRSCCADQLLCRNQAYAFTHTKLILSYAHACPFVYGGYVQAFVFVPFAVVE